MRRRGRGWGREREHNEGREKKERLGRERRPREGGKEEKRLSFLEYVMYNTISVVLSGRYMFVSVW